ncbi:hypothetical protein D0Z00_002840 [Geotrichum galactomycetum]|uniref:Uncharacterized protein n=1 Tax=Geotrichum galactomycetum TaxID=27317 RepID=A0ACB6V305_9ASCO|nr:hypothetical protein D0Z00_002840 [Geotrichum candidum]
MADIFQFDDIDEENLASQLQSVSLSVNGESYYDEGTELEDKLSELHTSSTVPIAIENNHRTMLSGSFFPGSAGSYSNRLGKSFEVGIDKPFVSSYVETEEFLNMPSTKKVPSDFEQLKVLGTGTYGKVILVREKKSGKLYAQKQLKKASMIVEEKKIQQTKTEKGILESVRHPYIVKLFYAMQDQEKLYLILEYAQGGELFHHLATKAMLTEDTVSFYCAEMVLALKHLHVNVGVVYRDLKPENCLLDADGHLVLTDFGLSKVAVDDDGRCKTFLGTLEYMAPEILKGEDYDYGVDWWSLGAVCYDLLTGTPPFTGNSSKMILNKIKKAKRPDYPFYISLDAQDILTRLLRKDPKKRLGYKDFETVFKKHRFFRKIDWKKLEARDPSLEPPIRPLITDPVLAENFSDSFTGIVLSPANTELLNTDNVVGGLDIDDQPFKGFSFTASQSFIDCAF